VASDLADLPIAQRETAPASARSAGGSGELLRLAAPLIVSQSFMTVQIFVDTVLLARHDALEMAAAFPAMMWFWLAFGLLQVTAGRGQAWTVLGIEAVGTGVNVAMAIPLISGRGGFPEMGIAGAGWATVAGSAASALAALGLFLLPRYRMQFATASGWRWERELFG